MFMHLKKSFTKHIYCDLLQQFIKLWAQRWMCHANRMYCNEVWICIWCCIFKIKAKILRYKILFKNLWFWTHPLQWMLPPNHASPHSFAYIKWSIQPVYVTKRGTWAFYNGLSKSSCICLCRFLFRLDIVHFISMNMKA